MLIRFIINYLLRHGFRIQYFTHMEPACFIDLVDFSCIILSRFPIVFGCEIHLILSAEG